MKKIRHDLAAAGILVCVVLGLTACQSREDLTDRLAGWASSVLKDREDGQDAERKAGADEESTSEESRSGERVPQKSISEERVSEGDPADGTLTEEIAAPETSTDKDTAAGNMDKTSQMEEMPKDLGIYLTDPSPYLDAYSRRPAIDTSYDTVHADEGAYPRLAQALEAFNAESAAVVAAWEEEHRVEAMAEREEYGEEYMSYTFDRDLSVMRADEHGVGISCDDSWKLGWMMSSVEYIFSSKNIDPLTGRDLALEDVIASIPQLERVLIDEYYAQRPEESSYIQYRDDAEAIIAGQLEKNLPVEEQPVWVLGCQGIIFRYNPGVITDGRGSMEIMLPYEKYPGLFKVPFQKEPEEFALYDGYGQWRYDLDHDGQLEEIDLQAFPAEYNAYQVRILLDNEEILSKTCEWTYAVSDQYLMKNKDGEHYLYVTINEIDEVDHIEVFKLTGNGAIYQGQVDGRIGNVLVTKPSHFDLCKRMGVLSYREAIQPHHMGSDGMPQADEEIYYLYGWDEEERTDESLWTYAVTTKKTLPAWRILEDGTISSTTEDILAGVKCTPVRTDDKTFVDILTRDGRLWRIDRQTDGGCASTIWGEDENGYFSDIVYAG